MTGCHCAEGALDGVAGDMSHQSDNNVSQGQIISFESYILRTLC